MPRSNAEYSETIRYHALDFKKQKQENPGLFLNQTELFGNRVNFDKLHIETKSYQPIIQSLPQVEASSQKVLFRSAVAFRLEAAIHLPPGVIYKSLLFSVKSLHQHNPDAIIRIFEGNVSADANVPVELHIRPFDETYAVLKIQGNAFKRWHYHTGDPGFENICEIVMSNMYVI